MELPISGNDVRPIPDYFKLMSKSSLLTELLTHLASPAKIFLLKISHDHSDQLFKTADHQNRRTMPSMDHFQIQNVIVFSVPLLISDFPGFPRFSDYDYDSQRSFSSVWKFLCYEILMESFNCVRLPLFKKERR